MYATMQPAAAGLISGANTEAELPPEKLRRNFMFFATNFAIIHGVVTTPLVLATSVLAGSAGYSGNAVLNIFTMVGSFFLGAPVVGALGLRGGVFFGMFFYVIYSACFTAAALLGKDGKDNLSHGAQTTQLIIFLAGSAFGGIAAGVLWTAQGVYFNRTVDLIHSREGGERASITATLASRFAVLFLGCEVVARLSWSILAYLEVEGWIIAGNFTIIGALALVSQLGALDLTSTEPQAAFLAQVTVAASLWSDPCIWLVAGINLTFGFSAAFMNGYISSNYTKPQLGEFSVTLLAAGTALCAGVFSHVFGLLSQKVGKGPVVVIGALSFFGIPLCFFALNGRKWVLIALYVLQGSGRAVYESNNKGIFSDLFSTNAPGAFANQMLQVTGALALCFFLESSLEGPTIAWIVLGLSLLAPVGYFWACALRRSQAKCEELD